MKLMLAVVLAAISILPVRAEDKSAAPVKPSWSDFFKTFKENLTKSAVSGERKKVRGAQRVGSVRGKPQAYADPDLNEPSLKGDMKSAKAKKELGLDSELEVLVDKISSGKVEEGLKGLEAFKVAHPKHQSESVDKAIEGAKAMLAEKNSVPAVKP